MQELLFGLIISYGTEYREVEVDIIESHTNYSIIKDPNSGVQYLSKPSYYWIFWSINPDGHYHVRDACERMEENEFKRIGGWYKLKLPYSKLVIKARQLKRSAGFKNPAVRDIELFPEHERRGIF